MHMLCLITCKVRSENGYGFLRPGQETVMGNNIFWSEIGSGLGDAGGTPPPKIARSTPPGATLVICWKSDNLYYWSRDEGLKNSKSLVWTRLRQSLPLKVCLHMPNFENILHSESVVIIIENKYEKLNNGLSCETHSIQSTNNFCVATESCKWILFTVLSVLKY